MQDSGAPGAIAMAVYRPQPDLLRAQVRSLAAQTLDTWCCHIGIDGADEAAYRLVTQLVADDDRFEVHHYDTNVGFYRNFERVLAEAAPGTPWFALSDQDDAWDDDKLERLVACLDDDPTVTAVVGQARLVDAQGRHLGITSRRSVPLGALILDNQVTGSLAVFRSAVVEMGLPFPEPTPVSYHDHWLGVVAASLGRVEFMSDVVQDYVQHSGNALGEETSRGVVRRLRALSQPAPRPGLMLDRVAQERWGWRALMATTATSRLGERAVPADLREFAQPRLLPISRVIGRSIVRRQAGWQRAIAIWVGFAWDRLTSASRK